ncbi:MAG: hypothetical protein NXI22_20135 [bacterium]|nr:hypothetical protein [bacterium]
MRDDFPVDLQPLRIPPHWRVTFNIFFEVDPTPDTMEWFNESMMLGILSDDGRYCIDLTFHPEDDPTGSYSVGFLRALGNPKANREPVEWECLGGGEFTSRLEVVATIERFMHDIWRYGEPNVGGQQ